jgi:hypothetical protein
MRRLRLMPADRSIWLMNKEDDYRRNAADTVQLAQRASSSEDKGRLLKLAEAWLDLADRARSTANDCGGRPCFIP